MSRLKKVIAVVAAFAVCISCMGALSACRMAKDETVATYKNGDKTVEVKAGTYLYLLLNAYSQFRSEYNSAVEEASATTSADLNYEKETLENKDYNTWIKDKTLELCAQYAYVETEFEKLGLEISSDVQSQLEAAASATWASGSYEEVYGPNGVSLSTFSKFFTNQYYKMDLIYDYYYGEHTDEEKSKDKNMGSLRPSDDEIIKNFTKYFALADTISISLTKSDSTSSDVVSLSDDEKAAAKKKLQGYADKLNSGTPFSTIYKEHNGSDISKDAAAQGDDKYATLYGSEETGNQNSSYFSEISKQKIGKAAVVEFSDCYMLVYKKDITKDSYYKEYLMSSVVWLMKYKDFTKDIEAKAKDLEATVNQSAVNYYTPKKVKIPTAAQTSTSAS